MMPTETLPDPGPMPITLVLPCLNEASYIEQCLLSLLNGDYPADLMEVLVLDGMSTDGTRDILTRLQLDYPQITVIDNLGASKPKALNSGLKLANHDIVMRIDAHAEYNPNYITELVRCLHVFGADNVGGIRINRTKGEGAVAQALATVLTHPFGVGNAKHYTGTPAPQSTDIIFLFCAHKSLFDDVGYFDERLTRGQDREFNLRMFRKKKKMILCPQVECTYFARETISGFTRWAINSGQAPFRISRVVGENLLSVRNFIPAIFVTSLLITLILGVFFEPARWLFLIIFGLYMSLAVLVSLQLVNQVKSISTLILLPFSFFSWHISYGWGSLKEIFLWATQGRHI